MHNIVGDEQIDVYLDFVSTIELSARIFIVWDGRSCCRSRSGCNESRTFVPTDIRSHAIFDRAGHSCSNQMTTPDIRAHIKWQHRTFVLTSNYHPGRSCSYQITTPDIRAHINFISFIYSLHAFTLLLIAWSLKKSTNEQVKV